MPCVGTFIPHVCSTNDIDEKKYYKIRNKKSGKYLEVSNGSYNNYGEIKQNDYNGGDHQKWSAVQTTDGYYKFISYNSGKALSCYENWNGANLYQYDYYKGDEKNKDGKKDKNKDKYKDNSHGDEDNYKAEEWKVECDKDGYKFTHKMSGRVCNVKNGSSDKGEKLELRDYSGGDEERFQLEEVTQNLQNTKVLSLSAAVEPNRTRIEWINNTGASNDFFQIEKLNTVTGVFETLENVKSLSSLDMEHYVSYDTKPIEGDNFYRINAISFDGSNNFSDVQKVNFKGLAGSLSIFPNPADEVLNIDLSNYKGSAVSLFVYNHLGQAVITQQIDKVSDGVIQIDISNQQMGNYLLRVYSKGKRDETKSFILNK